MPENPTIYPTQGRIRILHGVALAAFLAPLLLYMFTGTSTRFIQDDYCYTVHLRGFGWPNAALQAYMLDSGFSGNRIALTFFLDLAEISGPLNVPALPALMIIAWLPAVYCLARQLNRVLGWNLDRLTSALLSAGVVCLTLYLAPNRVQVLYWRPGMFTYLAPMVLFFWLAAWVASRLDRAANGWVLAGITVLAVIAGSFSETAAVFEGGVFALGLLAAFIRFRSGGRLAQNGYRLAWAGALGSLLAMAGLILSPAARLRQAAMFPDPPPPLQIIQITLQSAWFFVVHTLYRVTLPTLAIGGLALCLGYLAATQRRPDGQPPPRRLLLRLAAAAAAAFFLLMCVTAPSAYAEATYPEARVLLFARLILVIFSGAAGWWGGEALAGLLLPSGRAHWFAWLVSLPAVFYLGGMLLVQPGSLLEPAYPDLRAYGLAHPAILLAGLAVTSLLAALLNGLAARRRSAELAAALLACVFLFQPIFAARTALLELPDYQLRGQMWDVRDTQIRLMQSQGQRDITVRALDSWARITELQENPNHWVNRCAAIYYGVDSIKAVEPILNPPLRSVP